MSRDVSCVYNPCAKFEMDMTYRSKVSATSGVDPYGCSNVVTAVELSFIVSELLYEYKTRPGFVFCSPHLNASVQLTFVE